MTTESGTFKTPRGVEITAHFRPGTNDKDTLTACITQDCYHLTELIGEAPEAGPWEEQMCIDLGAHIGGASLLLASLGWEIYSVEVVPENEELLYKNSNLNKWRGIVHSLNRAIAAENKQQIVFQYAATHTPSGQTHRFMGNTSLKVIDPNRRNAVVHTISLNNLLNPLVACPLIKSDCEGAEWEAFSTVSPENLAKVKWITAELHNGGVDRFMPMLHGLFDDVSAEYGMPEGHIIMRRKQ